MTERLTAEELAEYRKIAATQMVLLSREDANKLLDAAEEAERLRAAIAEWEDSYYGTDREVFPEDRKLMDAAKGGGK